MEEEEEKKNSSDCSNSLQTVLVGRKPDMGGEGVRDFD